MRLVIGFSQGSASDQIARLIAPPLSREIGKEVAIELRPGSNGAHAACAVATAAPDGSTLFMATLGTHALAPHLDDDLPYDPVRDFAPVSLVTTSPLVLGCHASVGAADIESLIEIARAQPRALSYGTSAIGGAPHLAAELFQSLSGAQLHHVRYDHTERLYDDLEAGRIALSFNNVMSMLPRCDGRNLRALGITSAQRNPICEHVPTIAQSGLPEYEVSNWLGVVAPRATPAPVIESLSRALDTVLKSESVAPVLRAAGVTPCGGGAGRFADFMASEIARWRPVVARFRDRCRSGNGLRAL